MFQPGNELHKLRKRAGPISNKKAKVLELAKDIARRELEANIEPILKAYLGLAIGQHGYPVDPATTRHAVDKLVPDDNAETPSIVTINVLAVAGNSSQSGVHANGVEIRLGGGNGQNGNGTGGA